MISINSLITYPAAIAKNNRCTANLSRTPRALGARDENCVTALIACWQYSLPNPISIQDPTPSFARVGAQFVESRTSSLLGFRLLAIHRSTIQSGAAA